MKKKIALTVVALFALSACGTQYTFEADPEGGSGDNYSGDPSQIQCFVIEADSSNGDDGDVQLGRFCKEGGNQQTDNDDFEEDD